MTDRSAQLPDPIPGIRETIAAWQRRDEAYGRMLDAAQAGDDETYERARKDFWSMEGEIE